MQNTEEMDFSDVSGAVSYLKSEGCRISLSTFYRHQLEGKIRPQVDGSYTLAAVKKYKKLFLRPRDNATLLKEALDRELAKRWAFFTNDIETFCHTQAEKIVTLVGGDPSNVAFLREYLLDHVEDSAEMYSRKYELTSPSISEG